MRMRRGRRSRGAGEAAQKPRPLVWCTSAACWRGAGPTLLRLRAGFPPLQVDIINADTGGEAINSDFITMSDIKLWHTAPRWVNVDG